MNNQITDKQQTEAWRQARKDRLTASDVGAVLGLSKYRTREDVMRAKVREHYGAESEFTGNEATHWGQRHESDACNEFENDTGILLENCGLYVHPKYNWLAASPDRLTSDGGCLEAKAPFRARYTTASDEYQVQMQVQMACADRSHCYFVIWRPDEPIITIKYTRDPEWINRNIDTLQSFIDEYQAAISSEEAMKTHLEPLVQERDDDEWAKAAQAYIDAKNAADKAAQQEKEARKALLDMTDRAAQGHGVKVTPYERSGSIDWSKFAKDKGFGDEAEAYRKKPAVSWRITV